MIREFLTGVGLLFRGFATWRTAPGRMALGLIPAVIVGAVLTTGLVILLINMEGVVAALTPFADRWDAVWRDVLRAAASVALLIAAILLITLTFTTLTLIVGQPFYELVWRHA